MKTLSKPANRSCNLPMPESVRKAYEVAANTAWISAQTLADEKAEAAWREKLAVSEQHALETARMCAAQTTDILSLRTELASEKARAAVASSIAEQEATKLNQQIAVLTEDSERAVIRAAKVSSQLEALQVNLQAVQISARTTPSEINSEPQTPDARQDRLELPATDNRVAVDPISVAQRGSAEQSEHLRREEADLIAAATMLIKAVCRCRVFQIESATKVVSPTWAPEDYQLRNVRGVSKTLAAGEP